MKKLGFLLCFAVSPLVLADDTPPTKYGMYCIACHGSGVAGAPKVGDKAAWEPRLAQGWDALLASIKKGKNAMPPNGLCNDCSDAEFKELTLYMSGAKEIPAAGADAESK